MSERKKPSRGITARELKAQLAGDHKYQRKTQAAEAERPLRVQQLRRAEQPIVDDLRSAGCEVNSVWDLGNNSDPYPDALPVLLDHLQRGGYPDRVMESLGQALAVEQSASIWETLRQLYVAAQGRGEDDGLAAALAASATAHHLEDLIALLNETRRGNTRVHFLRPIKRVGRTQWPLTVGGKRGLDVLTSLQDDPLFGKEASALLKRRAH